MATRPIGLFVNRFEVCTRNNYGNASALAKQHVDSLFADSGTVPIALTCYNNVKPKYDIFEAARVTHDSQSGTQGGNVQTFKQMLETMPIDVDAWQSSIKIVYAEGTPRFKALFPKGKKTLNNGKQQNRLKAVAALILTIGSDASLAAVKITVQTFYTALDLAYNTKDTAKESTKTDSIAIEAARIVLMDEMEGNYGLLIAANKKKPQLAAKYFDEALMTNKLQMIFDLKVNSLATKCAIERTYQKPLTQQFQIANKTNTTAKVFLSSSRKGLIGLVFVTVPPNSNNIYNLTDMGDNATEKFLNFYNSDNKIKANLTVKVM
jgi:hypothetical protein